MSKVILTVDDAATIRSLIKLTLAKSGNYSVIEAEDGEDGLRVLENQIPDLVITDLNMPNLNGFGLVAAMKANPKFSKIPVVMLTTEDSPEHAAKGRELGIIAWVTKPFDPQTLLGAVKSIFSKTY